jgi:alpha-D-ribose 1-methylphosphonate 5-triphosphate diphosphatase PhnM
MVTRSAIDFLDSQEIADRGLGGASDDDATLLEEAAKVGTLIAEFPTTPASASTRRVG